MMTPKKNIEQAVGRIMRQKKEDRIMMPLVIDIVDLFSSFHKWSSMRRRFYNQKRYILENYAVNDDGEAPVVKSEKTVADYAAAAALDSDASSDEEDSKPIAKGKCAAKPRKQAAPIECDWD